VAFNVSRIAPFLPAVREEYQQNKLERPIEWVEDFFDSQVLWNPHMSWKVCCICEPPSNEVKLVIEGPRSWSTLYSFAAGTYYDEYK
jgi:hypothetical protein